MFFINTYDFENAIIPKSDSTFIDNLPVPNIMKKYIYIKPIYIKKYYIKLKKKSNIPTLSYFISITNINMFIILYFYKFFFLFF